MYARVASFNLGDGADQMVDQVRGDVESGNRPPGLEDAKGMMMLVDRSSGNAMGITLFDSEDAMKRGDEALNAMSPSTGSTPAVDSVMCLTSPCCCDRSATSSKGSCSSSWSWLSWPRPTSWSSSPRRLRRSRLPLRRAPGS